MRRGFTLIEMAVVLVIVGLIMLTVFPALTALRNNSQRSLTQSNLHNLMLATAAYAQAHGCLPCPTPAGTLAAGFGIVRGDGKVNPAACNSCTTAEGIPPFMSLGIPASVAHDGWGNWITMRIDTELANLPNAPGSILVPPFVPCQNAPDVTPNNICTAAQIGFSAKGLCRAQTTVSSAKPVKIQTLAGNTQNAAVIFVSYGVHGYGAFIADASTALITGGLNGCRRSFPSSTLSSGACKGQPSCPPGTLSTCANGDCIAQCNASGTNQFGDAPQMEQDSDVLAYLDRNMLVSLFGNGSCQSETW